MPNDWARVEELLRSIAEKKIDPDTAARSLLGFDSTISPAREIPSTNIPDSTPDSESLQSLVQRLGPPPPEVEEDWKRQIQSLAKSWQIRENRPLPPMALADWIVDAENRVSLSPKIIATANHETLPASAIQPAIDPAQEPQLFSASGPIAKRTPARKRRRVIMPAIAAAIAAVALILPLALAISRPSSPDVSSLASEQMTAPPREPRSPSPFEPGLIADPQPTVDEPADEPADEPVDLQAGVMALADAGPPVPELAVPELQPPRPDFGFDNPLLSGLAIDPPQPTATVTTPLNRPAAAETAAQAEADWDAVAADPSEPESVTIQDEPVESATPRQAVTLPPLRPALSKAGTAKDTPADNSTMIGVNLIRQVQWDFPTQTNIQFAPSNAEPGNGSDELATHWHWTDATSGTELATLDPIDQQLHFRWSEQTASVALSRQLAAGRLRLMDSTGQAATVFLRPHLRTAPLRLDASDTDKRFSWPLEGPAIYQAPNLNLQVTKPDDVDMSWIDPPDATNIRKQIATLQWAPVGKSSPAIRCRIECKTSTKLQMRLRYFAQLDSTFPWQPYSATQLTMALDQVTQLLERRTAELSQLETQYRSASTSEKRLIRPLKENVEQAVTQFRTVLQKLQQLNALHSAVATASHVKLTLTTDWPDGPQTLLEIPLPDQH